MQSIVVATFLFGAVVAAAAALEDSRHHRLPNANVAGMALTAIVGFSLAAQQNDETMPVASMALGASIFAGPWLISHLISPSSIGFGDIKYSAALGLYLGWLSPASAVVGFFAASASFAAVHWLRSERTSERRPFGPHLLVGWAAAVTLSLVT